MSFLGSVARIGAGALTLGGSEVALSATGRPSVFGSGADKIAPPAQSGYQLRGNADANSMAMDYTRMGAEHAAANQGLAKQQQLNADVQAQKARDASAAQSMALQQQSTGNYAAAGAAQGRTGPQVQSAMADKQRQLAALGMQQQSADSFQRMGEAPMGDSYAAAQMKQGLNAGMAQQLSMARSGRSLGSGQAAMGQAMMNNSAMAQQTNQAAGVARIQEQNAYKQQQLAALGAAQQGYSNVAAQSAGFRGANDQQDSLNAQLQQQQMGINNQTTQAYGSLAGQQASNALGYSQLGAQTGLAYNQLGAQQAMGYNQLADQQNYAYQGMGLDVLKTQLAASGNYEATKAGIQGQNITAQSNRDAAVISGAAALGGAALAASDSREKKDKIRAEGIAQGLAAATEQYGGALTGKRAQLAALQQPDTGALDAAYRQQGGAPQVDLRGAPGYSYEYKHPGRPGQEPGKQIGPMAQDLERTAAAPAVTQGPGGVKMIDQPHLSLINTAAISEQQRRMDDIERRQRQLAALQMPDMAAIPQAKPGLYPTPQAPY